MTSTAHDLLLALWLKNGKDWQKTYEAIKKRERVDVDEALEGVDRSAYITITDEDYPEECKRFFRPPFVLERGWLK